MVFSKTVDGNKVRLRHITLSDAGDMFEWASDPEVSRHLPWDPHQNLEETRAYIRECLNAYRGEDWLPLAIETLETGKVEGNIALYAVKPRHGIAELAFVLAKNRWGGGFTSEAATMLIDWAFQTLALNRIQAVASVENKHSFSTLESLGMQSEGILRGYMIINGELKDARMFSLLRREWEERRSLTE